MTHTYSTCDAIARHGGVLDLVLCGEAKSARQLLAGQKDPVCSARESPPALLAWTHPAGTASARATAGKHVPMPAHASGAVPPIRASRTRLACNVCSRCQGWCTDWTLGVPLHAVRCVAASYLLYIYKFIMAPSMGAVEALDMNYDARKYTVCCPWYGQRSSLFRLWQQAF